jgi:hypothetical protein
MSRYLPSSKVTASGLAGAVVTWVVWALENFWGYTLPAEVAAAAVTLATFVLGYVVTENRPAGEPKVTFTPDPSIIRDI